MLFFCLLLPLTYVHGGRVKTIGGKQMPKDSVAELDVYEQFESIYLDSTWWVGVREIDSLRLYELNAKKGKEQRNPDSIFENPSDLEKYLLACLDVAWAKDKKKVYVMPGRHEVQTRCAGMFTEENTRTYAYSYVHSLVVPLQVDLQAKHRYRLGAAIKGTEWRIWIEDRDTKEVIASTK